MGGANHVSVGLRYLGWKVRWVGDKGMGLRVHGVEVRWVEANDVGLRIHGVKGGCRVGGEKG